MRGKGKEGVGEEREGGRGEEREGDGEREGEEGKRRERKGETEKERGKNGSPFPYLLLIVALVVLRYL